MNKYQQESRKGKRKKLYDLSKKNGIDDYNVYMPPPMRDHETKYSAGLNGISVYKNEKIYHMPSDFNILLNDENVIIDSSNSFEVAKLFIRLNTTDNVYFDESYFETEPPGFGLGEVFNVIVLTHGDNDMYNMKWGFMFLFNLGEIGHVYYQDLDDKGQYEKEGKWGAASPK